MKAKEKAEELMKQYCEKVKISIQEYAGARITELELNDQEAIECALICVDEIQLATNENFFYWQEVKQHLIEMK